LIKEREFEEDLSYNSFEITFLNGQEEERDRKERARDTRRNQSMKKSYTWKETSGYVEIRYMMV
jgi:hypothetical protein